MPKAFQRVKGAEDLYPDEMCQQVWIAEQLRAATRRAGFLEVDCPAIETIKCLAAKSGEEIRKQIFVFEKKGAEELGLRFDLTVPLTRMFVAKQKQLPLPIKWFAINKMWRYEAPQKGRLREFSQLSVELFGSQKAEADAEVLNLLISCLEALGLTAKDVEIRLNNRKLLEGLLAEIVGEKRVPEVARVVDKRKKVSEQQFIRELLELGLDQVKATRVAHVTQFTGSPAKVFAELRKHVPDPSPMAKEGLEELKAIIPLVPKEWITIDLSTARGLVYYTGTVFEAFAKGTELRSLAGGGRYDKLVETLGGPPCPAAGFAPGFVPLTIFLQEKGLFPKPQLGPEYFIAVVSPELSDKGFEIARKLRKKAGAVVDIDLMQRKLGKQLDYASSIGAKKVVIVGPKDLKENKVTVRDLKSGKEKKVKLSDLS